MLDKYWLKYDNLDEPVGELLIDFKKDKFNFIQNPKYDGELPFFLEDPESSMPMEEQIKIWIENRVPERNYTFIDVLIEKAGLKDYDIYGFFKYNKGQFISDKFYIESK